MAKKIVISASRRTDIPAFYMDPFMDGIARGGFHVKNPFNGRVSLVPAGPEAVGCIVFWSKDFGRFLEGGYGTALARMGYEQFFLFTVNSASTVLEPNLPSLATRIAQAEQLADQHGPRSVWWRFDPICFYQYNSGPVQNNLADFPWIAQQMAHMGVKRCITSFVDIYAKVARRVKAIPGFSFVDPPMEKKIRVIRKMADLLEPMHISLYTCCENELTDGLPGDCNVKAGGCISGHYLEQRFEKEISLAGDSGQRRDKGCKCTASRDIGCYDAHPCLHNCLYCYANTNGRNQAGPAKPQENVAHPQQAGNRE
ncbi:MAG: DUF1848 family protein [Desulfosalsimonadaceae bacterium]